MWTKIGSGLRSTLYFVVLVCSLLYGWDWLDRHHQDVVEKQETTVHQIIGNPFVHLGDGKQNNIAHPGGLVFVHNEYIKTEKCHVQVANLLIDKATKNVHHFSQFLNWFPAGTFTANEMFHLPEWLPPAKYRLVKKSTSFCGDKTYYFINFDVEINVQAKVQMVPPTTKKKVARHS